MKRSECTPEQWEDYKARQLAHYYANHAKIREQRKVLASTPEAKAVRRARDSSPERLAMRRVRDRKAAPETHARIKANPQRWAAKMERQRKNRTGLCDADYKALLEAQQNSCAVCQRPFEGRQIRRDHCHDTNKPRGLLCHHCNIIEGMIRSMGLCPGEYGNRLKHYLYNPPFKALTS